MPNTSNSAVRSGVLLILIGAAFNTWAVQQVVFPDRAEMSRQATVLAVVVESACILAGISLLLVRWPAVSLFAGNRKFQIALGILLVLGLCANTVAYFRWQSVRSALHVEQRRENIKRERLFRQGLRQTYDSEQLLVALMSKLDDLSSSVLNFAMPDYKSRNIFSDRVLVHDLESAAPLPVHRRIAPLKIELRHWQVAEQPESISSNELVIWSAFLRKVHYFDHAKFYFIRGQFSGDDRTELVSEIGFTALARTRSQQWQTASARVKAVWKRDMPAEDLLQGWRMHEFRTERFDVSESTQLSFSENLDMALVDASDRRRARESIHGQLVVQSVLDPDFQKPHEFFVPPGWDRNPGVSVVDIDRDGFDDFYVTARWGRNQFFHNQRDGTFHETASDLGLDVPDHTSCSLFADFDNDGDPDVFLGRTMQRSMYLENKGGRFVDRSTSHVRGRLPYFSSSISAVDYDGDGLLDVYLSTYAAQTLRHMFVDNPQAMNQFFDSQEIQRIDELRSSRYLENDHHDIMNFVGPGNVLLKNVGNGEFEIVRDTPLNLFANTLQSTWADMDGDGDPDVYCANDFGPDNLYRNDGNGVFVDITRQAGITTLGLAMGASWGDYDNDGTFDLYVSNMFSKAGRRITGQIPGLDHRFSQIAQGNFLYLNRGNQFTRASGTEPGELQVEKAGWSWGGQFVDFNNDAWLDIYVLSGFYTPPTGLAQPGDF